MYPETQGRPFASWLQHGRVVRAGERAHHYLVSPDGAQGVALFREDQTEALTPPEIDGWSRIVPAEEWRTRKKGSGLPKVRVKQRAEGLAVWCGPNKDAIKLLKKAGWRFDRHLNRWVHSYRDVDAFAKAMREKGFEVIVDA